MGTVGYEVNASTLKHEELTLSPNIKFKPKKTNDELPDDDDKVLNEVKEIVKKILNKTMLDDDEEEFLIKIDINSDLCLTVPRLDYKRRNVVENHTQNVIYHILFTECNFLGI